MEPTELEIRFPSHSSHCSNGTSLPSNLARTSGLFSCKLNEASLWLSSTHTGVAGELNILSHTSMGVLNGQLTMFSLGRHPLGRGTIDGMNTKLTPEQAEALHQNGDELTVVDPTTNRIYVVVDQSILARAQAVLQRQQEDDLAAIREGVADMEAGRTLSAEEAHDQISRELHSKFGS